jgi:hypothetical protein
MSEVKLNLIDSQQVLHGTIHGSVADSCVAALSAEPETIGELSAALARYIKPVNDCQPFATFRSSTHSRLSTKPGISLGSLALDTDKWDAGIVIIDLTARIVACESTYSQPSLEGEVHYHDGTQATDVSVPYRLPDDWLFVNSMEAYQWSRERRAERRLAQTPLDARQVLYGAPLLNFIIDECRMIKVPESYASNNGSDRGEHASTRITAGPTEDSSRESTDESTLGSSAPATDGNSPAASNSIEASCQATTSSSASLDASEEAAEALSKEISAIHARWLMTPREDLGGQSPRDVLLAKQDLIDFDLHTRSLQWSFLNEGPPCLSPDSFAYRYAGFGTHEWVIYYDLVRELLWTAPTLWSAPTCRSLARTDLSLQASLETKRPQDNYPLSAQARESLLSQLEKLKSDWLDQPQPDYSGRIPAILIDNERRRLPIALRPRDMIIDDDCPMCQMFGDETSPLGMGVGFWHLDGCNMDEDFAFSHFRTREEWEAENRQRAEFSKEFDRRWKERQERIARGEQPEPDPFFDSDPFPGLAFDDAAIAVDDKADEDEKEVAQ